jgi:hypothetical protein
MIPTPSLWRTMVPSMTLSTLLAVAHGGWQRNMQEITVVRFPENCWMDYAAVARFIIGYGVTEEHDAYNFARGYARWVSRG